MIALTQEKREELIAHNTAKLKGLKQCVKQTAFESVREELELDIQSTEVTLASLTSDAVGSFHIYEQKVDATTDYVRDGEWPIDEGELLVYAAPPVPEIKDHQIREMVTEITGTAKKYQGCQCLRDAISKVVIKHLNGLGE